MKRFVFIDLDDTLFQSLRKCPDTPRQPVAFGRNGTPLSFMTAKQQRLFGWLTADAEVVPTTGRSSAALRRIELSFDGYAICCFGGAILEPDGSLEPEWNRWIVDQAAVHLGTSEDLQDFILAEAERAEIDVRVRLVGEGTTRLYVCVKHRQGDAAALARLVPAVRRRLPPEWKLHLNDNNLAVLPPFLGKERAVAWFLEHYADPSAVTIGVGDSLTDIPFMALCDYALTPTGSQLFSRVHDRV